MFRFWARAEEAEAGTAAAAAAAEAPSSSSEEAAAAPASTPAAEAPTAASAPAEAAEPAPEPPREPTAEEIEATKSEIVQEAVDKIMDSVGGDLLANEVVTAPYDPRFPATNQARHCFVRYNEHYKCVFERGPDSERCAFYKRAYESLCPEEWVEQWQELREKGLWMGKY